MPIIRDAQVEFQQLSPGIKSRQLVNQERGAGAITLGEAIMEPATSLPLHTHKVEEAFFIAEGPATIILGDDTYTMETNSAILAPAGVSHLVANKSQKPIRFLFFYPTVQVQREAVED